MIALRPEGTVIGERVAPVSVAVAEARAGKHWLSRATLLTSSVRTFDVEQFVRIADVETRRFGSQPTPTHLRSSHELNGVT